MEVLVWGEVPLLLPSTGSAEKGAETLVIFRVQQGKGFPVFEYPHLVIVHGGGKEPLFLRQRWLGMFSPLDVLVPYLQKPSQAHIIEEVCRCHNRLPARKCFPTVLENLN